MGVDNARTGIDCGFKDLNRGIRCLVYLTLRSIVVRTFDTADRGESWSRLSARHRDSRTRTVERAKGERKGDGSLRG